MTRRRVAVSVRLCGKRWVISDGSELSGLFGELEGVCRGELDRRGLKWIKGAGLAHLNRDYRMSPFLVALGVSPMVSYVDVGVCEDGKLDVDMMVRCSDGMSYGRCECLSSSFFGLPLPEEIARRSERFYGRREFEDSMEENDLLLRRGVRCLL